MIQGLFNQGGLPALERLVQFTAARQRVLADNIANVSTPGFQPRDLDPKAFQKALGQAVAERRHAADAAAPLRIEDTRDLAFKADSIEVKPRASNQGVLFHDQNNRDLERLMQHLAENTITHNASIDMMRSQFDMLRTAIRERV